MRLWKDPCACSQRLSLVTLRSIGPISLASEFRLHAPCPFPMSCRLNLHKPWKLKSDNGDVYFEGVRNNNTFATRRAGRVDACTSNKSIHCKQVHPNKKEKKLYGWPIFKRKGEDRMSTSRCRNYGNSGIVLCNYERWCTHERVRVSFFSRTYTRRPFFDEFVIRGQLWHIYRWTFEPED